MKSLRNICRIPFFSEFAASREFRNEHRPSFSFLRCSLRFIRNSISGEGKSENCKNFYTSTDFIRLRPTVSSKQLRILLIFSGKIFLEIFFHLLDLELLFSWRISSCVPKVFSFFLFFFFFYFTTLFRVKINIFRQTYYAFPTCSFFFFFIIP